MTQFSGNASGLYGIKDTKDDHPKTKIDLEPSLAELPPLITMRRNWGGETDGR